jgi:hypothetical protein
MRRLRRARALILAAVVVALTTGAQKSSRPKYGIPKLKPGQLWISSVPVGLEVYLGARAAGKPAGRTPLLLPSARDVSKVTVVLPKTKPDEELPNQFDFADHTTLTTTTETHVEGTVKVDVSRALTYPVDAGSKPTLIALFQPKSAPLSDWARRYPPGSNFRFPEDRARRDLAARGVPPEFVDLGIQLLRKGGKVSLPTAKGWIVAEVTASGEVSISTPPA